MLWEHTLFFCFVYFSGLLILFFSIGTNVGTVADFN